MSPRVMSWFPDTVALNVTDIGLPDPDPCTRATKVLVVAVEPSVQTPATPIPEALVTTNVLAILPSAPTANETGTPTKAMPPSLTSTLTDVGNAESFEPDCKFPELILIVGFAA